MQHLTRAIWALFFVGVHAAIGMACYAHFVADTITPGSALFWGWLGAWPIMLLLMVAKWVLIGAGIIVAIVIAFVLAVGIPEFIRSYRAKKALRAANDGDRR